MGQVEARKEPSLTRWTNMTDKTANLDQHTAKLVQIATNFGVGACPDGAGEPTRMACNLTIVNIPEGFGFWSNTADPFGGAGSNCPAGHPPPGLGLWGQTAGKQTTNKPENQQSNEPTDQETKKPTNQQGNKPTPQQATRAEMNPQTNQKTTKKSTKNQPKWLQNRSWRLSWAPLGASWGVLGPSWRQDGPKSPQEGPRGVQDSFQDRFWSHFG